MPWWATVLIGLIVFVLTWVVGKFTLDPILGPKADRIKLKCTERSRRKRDAARQKALERGQRRHKDQHVLADQIRPFLEELCSMDSPQGIFESQAFYVRLKAIGGRVSQIESPEFQNLRKKLLEFSNKRDEIRSSMSRPEWRDLIFRKNDGLEPRRLLSEVDKALRKNQ